MYKHFIFSLIVSMLPSLCLAENPRITRLMREKQAKMEQLEKCMGSSKGLKIAGISTLGLTAVGVAGNIAEAKAIQEYDTKIEKTDKNIEKTKLEIQEKRDALAEKEEAEAKRIEAEEQAKREGRILRKVALEDIARINNSGFNGDKAVSHGYMPDRLPDSLRKQFADAMVNFIIRCRSLIGQYGIEDVSLTPTEQERWGQYSGSAPLTEDAILEDLNEHLLAECKIIKCNETTHTFVYDGYGTRCDVKLSAVVPDSENKTTQPTTTPENEQKPEDKTTVGTTPENEQKPEDKTTEVTTPENEQKPDDTDCITEAKQKDSDAKTAKYKSGVCKITACTTSSKEPSKDGQTCVAKQNNNVSKIQNINQGDFEGASVCSSTSGSTVGKSGNPDLTGSGDTKYCWCKVNKYKGQSVNTSWLFGYANNTASECSEKCKSGCANGGSVLVPSTAKTVTVQKVSVSDFSDVQVGSLDQCKSLVRLYAKERGLNLTYVSYEEKSNQDYLTYKYSDEKKYVFEFDDCSETFASAHRMPVYKALCKIYGGTPQEKNGGVKCPLAKSKESINADLATFNSAYEYSDIIIDSVSCGSSNMNCHNSYTSGFKAK